MGKTFEIKVQFPRGRLLMIHILYLPFKWCGFGECALCITMSHQKKDVVISMFCPMGFSSILGYRKFWRKISANVFQIHTRNPQALVLENYICPINIAHQNIFSLNMLITNVKVIFGRRWPSCASQNKSDWPSVMI